jgi:hypothetical protein
MNWAEAAGNHKLSLTECSFVKTSRWSCVAYVKLHTLGSDKSLSTKGNPNINSNCLWYRYRPIVMYRCNYRNRHDRHPFESEISPSECLLSGSVDVAMFLLFLNSG